MESLKIATIIGLIISSSIECASSTNDSLSNTPSDIFLRSKPGTENTTPTDLITDVTTSYTTGTGIISSSKSAGDSCSLLDLPVGKLPLNSKFMVFTNFSYDGSTFCLKWTIVGDLKDVRRCAIMYIFKYGMERINVKCPLVNNEIKTWTSEDEIYRICVYIFARSRTIFCNDTIYRRTTAAVSETNMLTETTPVLQNCTTSIVTETTSFKSTETVRLTEDTTNNRPDYHTVSISVYSNSSNTTSDIFLATEPSVASRAQSTKDNAATSITPRELGTVDPQKMESLKTATIIGLFILSCTECTTSTNDRLSNTPSDIFLRSKPGTENTKPDDLITDVTTSYTTATGIISSSMSAGDSCSFLDLSVGKLPLTSTLTVFRNFSYDGSTFCLKWTIVGDLKDVKSCVIKYTFKNGTKSIRVKCPLVNNEMQTWTSKEEIYKICLDIYAPKRTSFCNYTLYGRTTAAVSETNMLSETTSALHVNTTSIVTETTSFKSTETVRLDEDTTDNRPDYHTVSISVYSNSSNITSDKYLATEPSVASRTQSTKDNAAASITPRELGTVEPHKVPSKEGYSDEKTINENDSTGSTMTKEFVTLSTKSIIHTNTSNISAASTSTASIIESITPTKDILSNTTSNIFLEKHIYIPFICLLILLIVIVAIIIFKNKKKQEAKRYDVLDAEDKYDQRGKCRSQSRRDQSIYLSDLHRGNFDDV